MAGAKVLIPGAGIVFRHGVVALQERLPPGEPPLRGRTRRPDGFALPDCTPCERTRP